MQKQNIPFEGVYDVFAIRFILKDVLPDKQHEHAARLMIGSDYRYLLPAAIFLGAATVMLSDTFARVAFAPVELPVGIIMAAIGAPFFLFLLRREL